MVKKQDTKKTISCDVFYNQFKSQKLASLYFVYGDERYLKNKAAKMIIDRGISPENRDFDFITIYGDDTSPYEVVDSFTTQPFFAERKVVWLKKFDSLKTSDQQKIINEYMKVHEGSLLVLTADKFDSRLKIAKQMMSVGIAVQCKRPYKAEDMLPWLRQEAKKYSLNFDTKAALLFVNKVELDYYNAANELEKLSLYCLDKNYVITADVQACTGDSKTHNIFDLYNSIGQRKIRESLIIIENLIENREAPVFIITMLTRFFSQLWKINALRAARYSDKEIMMSHINEINYYFRNDYMRFSRNYPLRVLPKVFSCLLESDTQLKSVNLDESLIIECMMFSVFALK